MVNDSALLHGLMIHPVTQTIMLLSPVYLSNHAMTNCLYQENKSNDWLFTFTMVNIIRQFCYSAVMFRCQNSRYLWGKPVYVHDVWQRSARLAIHRPDGTYRDGWDSSQPIFGYKFHFITVLIAMMISDLCLFFRV